MKRGIVAGLSILAVAAGVGWKVASHTETSAGLQEVSLQQNSEHAQPGPATALAGIRIRLSGSELRETDPAALAGIRIRLSGSEVRTTDSNVPQIPVAD
jgi:hypothetical protein